MDSPHNRSTSRNENGKRDRRVEDERVHSKRRRRSREYSRSRSPDDLKTRNSISQSKTRDSASASNAAAIAAAKALELTKSLKNKDASTSNSKAFHVESSREASIKEARAKEIQAQLAAQMASFTNRLASVPSIQLDRKAAYRPLRLDASGREIDEKGNLVKKVDQVKTLAANVAVGQAQKKKENPYLSHRSAAASRTSASAADEASIPAQPIVDERLKTCNRDVRGRRTFNFVEAGTFVKQADQQRHKEERKIIAGFSSGRRAPEVAADENDGALDNTATEVSLVDSSKDILVPPPSDNGVVPSMEWWDEAFLPKILRDNRRKSRAKQEQDDFEDLSYSNCKTFKYIQHPVPVKPLGGDKHDEALQLYLTKRERKRIRRSAREEREREKRDKMLMGLIPPPEPKFKLSNFMKILGDQAISDPSKVEKRVVQQMQQRQLNHEMRNQAQKLTPTERKEKKRKKLMEDTSRQVHVAIFRVKDFSDPKHRFKVDVNVQQLNLSGAAVLCPSAAINLVIVEGGPKGIRNIVKLMTRRVAWNKRSENIVKRGAVGDVENPSYYGNASFTQHSEESNAADIDDEISNASDDMKTDILGGQSHENDEEILVSDNRCDLLWQGIVARRTFSGFRFQECRTSSSARRVLEAKGVAQYWDMAVRADNMISATEEIS